VKEMEISLDVKITLKRHDVHWSEEELLRVREEAFLVILRRIFEEVEREGIRGRRACPECGGE